MEPLAASRGVHGRAGRWIRHAHAEPPPPSRRQHVHRDARRRSRDPRGQDAVAAGRAVHPSMQLRARHRGRPGAGARRNDRLRGAPCRRERVRLRLPRSPGEDRRGDVLHERNHRPAEGRPLLAPRDRRPRADGSRIARLLRRRRVPAGRPDVPRERLVLPVLRDADGRQAGLPRAAHGSRDAARRLRRAEGDGDGRRSDDLDGHPAAARCESRQVGSLGHEVHDRRRRGAAARHDRGVRRATRSPHRPRLGHDRDEPGRDDLRRARSGDGPLEGRDVLAPRAPGPHDPLRRDPRARHRRARPVGRRDDGRARGARAVDLVGLLRLRRRRGPLDGRRLVQDRRRRVDPPRRLRRGAGPCEGPREVGRRVDLHGRARERAHGTSRRRRGGSDRRTRREVVGAPARGRRLA